MLKLPFLYRCLTFRVSYVTKFALAHKSKNRCTLKCRPIEGLTELFSLKVKTLVNLNSTFLMLACRKENYKTLLEDWTHLLDTYPILCDLWSDVVETTQLPKLEESLERLDKQGEMPYGQPVPDQDGYVILFTQKHFEKQAKMRWAITLHELGHFYVYQTGMLKNLRGKWPVGGEMFEVFVGIVKQDSVWYNEQKEWLRRLYEYYVFDVVKIPGEIYANWWVKENFINTFNLVVDGQLEKYEYLANNIDKNIETKVAKFPLFSIVLRLEGLLMVINGVTKDAKEKLEQLLAVCWKKMSRFLHAKEIETFEQTKQKIMDVCSSPQTSDRELFNVFQRYVNNNILEPEDFQRRVW